jgi:hypothetical protein
MTEQDKVEIRQIIKEEIEANSSKKLAERTSTPEAPVKTRSEVPKYINIETVSPTY